MILYGGTRGQVEMQMACEHEWVEAPVIGDGKVYSECVRCRCVERKVVSQKDVPSDVVGARLDRFVRRYFEVLRELEFVKDRRSEALDVAEQRREEIYELKKKIKELEKVTVVQRDRDSRFLEQIRALAEKGFLAKTMEEIKS